MTYLFNILIVCEIYFVLSLATNLLASDAGLFPLCQAAFYGIGAYSEALLSLKAGWNFPSALLGSVFISILACCPVIWFAVRLRGLFFTLCTLSWQIVVFAILYNWTPVTNGAIGLIGIPRPRVFGITLLSNGGFAIFAGIIVSFIVIFFTWLSGTPMLRTIRGVRDDQLAVMALGKRPSYYKALTVLLSSAIASVAGVLFASYYSYIDATSFSLDESIMIISMVLIGGLGTIRGAFSGALLYVLLPEVLRFLTVPDSVSGNVRLILYSLLLILVVRFRPYGLFGKFKFD